MPCPYVMVASVFPALPTILIFVLRAEAEFVPYAEQQDACWPWWQYGGGPAELQSAVGSIREVVKRYQPRG